MSLAVAPERKPLPERWRWVRLGDVCRVVGGSTPTSSEPEYWDGSIVWVTPTDLGQLQGFEISASARRITPSGLASCSTEMIPVGTVVLSSRAPIGHLGVAQVPLCTNQGCKSFVPGLDVDSMYLYYALKQAVPVLRSLGSGATFAEVSKSALSAFTIPLPPLPEQRRIAAMLTEQMAAVDKARAAVQAQLDAARALPEGYLRSAFDGIVPLDVGADHPRAPSGWRWTRLTDVARLESGHTPSRRHPEWWNGDIPWLALPDIRKLDGKIALHTLETTNELGIANSSARVLPKNTVVLSRTASVGFVTLMGRPMATSQDFANWVCGPTLDPRFLMWLFIASRRKIRALASGAIHMTVYMNTLKRFEVCVPSLADQRAIVGFLDHHIDLGDQLQVHVGEQVQAVDRLPAKLLQSALQGGL